MPGKDHGPAIRKPDTYEDLREQGYDKGKAAAISNAQANPHKEPSKKGGETPAYEDWTRDELYGRAQEFGIEGRSDMTRGELIEALRR